MDNDSSMLNIIERMIGSFKNAYSNMLAYFEDKELDKKENVILLNIEMILKPIYQYTDYKDEAEIEKLQNIELFIASAIMNVVAHYRHFFVSKLKANNTFILYMKDEECYENNAVVMRIFSKIADILPKMICLPKINSVVNQESASLLTKEYGSDINKTHCYTHILNHLLYKIKEKKGDIAIHLISEDKSDLPLMNVSKYAYYYKRVARKFMIIELKEVWNEVILRNSKLLFQTSGMTPYLSILISPMLSLFGFNKHNRAFKTTLSKFKLNKKRIERLMSFISGLKGSIPTDKDQLLEFDYRLAKAFELDSGELNVFIERTKNFRYELHEIPKVLAEQILAIKSKTVYDENIRDINNVINNNFPNKSLNLKWLYETNDV